MDRPDPDDLYTSSHSGAIEYGLALIKEIEAKESELRYYTHPDRITLTRIIYDHLQANRNELCASLLAANEMLDKIRKQLPLTPGESCEDRRSVV